MKILKAMKKWEILDFVRKIFFAAKNQKKENYRCDNLRKIFLCARIYYIINYIIIIKYIINYIIILNYIYIILYNYIKIYITSKINYIYYIINYIISTINYIKIYIKIYINFMKNKLKFLTKTAKDILITPDYEVIGANIIYKYIKHGRLGRRVYRGGMGGEKGRKPRFEIIFCKFL